jgi:uncharacterized lipoprotein YddW (UPF0748 family)
MRKIVVGSVIGTLVNSLVLLPVAWADAVKLGVVKSQENEGQWSGITTRLHSIGVAYCIVDFSKVQQTSDLGSTQLLFLPNIERLEPVQLAALQDWMGKGGRVIVSGPMGTLSQPEVRNQLRSLLGAYWGFALTKPSTLEPLRTNGQTWVRNAGLAATIQGGVVIPAGLNSLTAAAWSQSDNSPAVVTTEQSTFFGWRWGVDEVAPAAVDSAWLRAALGRYNLAPTTGRQKPKESEQYCVSSQTPTVNKPITPLPNRDEQNTPPVGTPTTPGGETQVDPHEEVAPAPIKPNNTGPLTAMQVAAMSQELENLIGRFESALLAANATNSNLNIQTSAAIEQFLGTSTNEKLKVEPSTLNGVAPTTATNSASRAIAQARMGLQNFRDAATRNDYRGARQYWSDARRTLWNNYPIDRKFAQPEIRAIWLDRGTIVRAKSEQDLAKVFDQLAAMGFNTVFFETVNASYPIYPSRVAPEQNPLVRGWDPLAAAVKLAHERGMELHAWVWLFAAANQRHNALLNQPANYPGPVLAAHPDWAIVNRQGRLFDQNTKKAFLDPANPEVRRYLMALLEEIVTRYAVDGIQLDYIRYPFQDPTVDQTYGYSQVARQQFQELTGVDPIKVYPRQRDLWQKWIDFRIRQIDSFVLSLSQRLRSAKRPTDTRNLGSASSAAATGLTQRPSLILSAAVFALPRTERLQRLQQNWEDWAIRGDIDLMVPMTYALDTNGLQKLAEPLLRQSTLSSVLILPGIRLLNLPDIVAIDQMQLLRDSPAGGYALFAVENLDVNLRDIFSRTQGGGERGLTRVGENFISSSQSPIPSPQSPTPEPVPYRQPFPAAAARYAALQREWNFLLKSNQILIREPALSEWGKQADALSASLNQLAAEPSMRNLSSAKASLSSFRAQFQKWMASQSVEHPYQVQVWDNRLATIERLLRYGERIALNRS